jgi:hypothetical protein
MVGKTILTISWCLYAYFMVLLVVLHGHFSGLVVLRAARLYGFLHCLFARDHLRIHCNSSSDEKHIPLLRAVSSVPALPQNLMAAGCCVLGSGPNLRLIKHTIK